MTCYTGLDLKFHNRQLFKIWMIFWYINDSCLNYEHSPISHILKYIINISSNA